MVWMVGESLVSLGLMGTCTRMLSDVDLTLL
jgi:hypothetical protein